MAYRDRSRLSDWANKQHRRLGAISEGIRWRIIEKTRIRKRLAALTARGSIDSFEAAELLEQPHATVLTTIDQMLAAQTPREWCKPADRLGRRAFRLNRAGFTLLAMNLPGKRALQERLRIIELFNEMWDATNHDPRQPEREAAAVARPTNLMADEATLGVKTLEAAEEGVSSS
jgi:hypothetical protein